MVDAPEPWVTKHARRRIKQRAKLPPRAAARAAKMALLHGQDENHPALTPPVRAKIIRTRDRYAAETGVAGIYRVYQGLLFIFSAYGSLLTVLEGFDDPDQKGRFHGKDGVRWKNGELKRFKSGRRPRQEGDEE